MVFELSKEIHIKNIYFIGIFLYLKLLQKNKTPNENFVTKLLEQSTGGHIFESPVSLEVHSFFKFQEFLHLLHKYQQHKLNNSLLEKLELWSWQSICLFRYYIQGCVLIDLHLENQPRHKL